MQKDPNARVVETRQWGDYFQLSIESPEIASMASPGQFLMVRVSSLDFPLLRRPFSIHARDQNMLEIFFQVTGLGTALLSQKKISDSLDILGPLGQGFTLGEDIKGKGLALIGGGRGIAPLYFLAQETFRRGAEVSVFYGGKTQSDLPLREKFAAKKIPVFCSSDDGSYGFHGLVTSLFVGEAEKKTFKSIYACGPEAMLKKIGQLSARMGIPAELSLESMMGCGFGACWGCVTKIKGPDGAQWQKTCEKGPVFSSENIIWPNGEQ